MLSIVHVVFVDCITVIIVLYLSVIISCIIVFCRLLGMESDLKTWVSDKLMSLLGFSQPTLVQYLISLSKKASSPCDVYNCLKDMQVSSLNDTQAFAEEIFRKVEHKSSGSNAVALPVRKQRNFELLADDGDIAETVKSDKKAKSFRKKRKTVEDEDDDDDESEEERVRDKKERAELERRLRKKEVPWTTKVCFKCSFIILFLINMNGFASSSIRRLHIFLIAGWRNKLNLYLFYLTAE
uniref:Putative PWI domain-containing protein n=1 Tax=Helianthus annuus TaxID=4232 RepID=A0A251T796_HELAN